MKRQYTEWEEIWANDVTGKGLTFKIRIAHITKTEKKNHPIKKRAESLNRHFSKEDTYIDGQQARDYMLIITTYQRHTNQNNSEEAPHTCQNGHP